jgi:hypothetical protein
MKFRKLVDIEMQPGGCDFLAALISQLRKYSVVFKQQSRNFATDTELRRIMVRQDHLCLSQTVLGALRHANTLKGSERVKAMMNLAGAAQ